MPQIGHEPGPGAHDLGMHRTGVLGVGRGDGNFRFEGHATFRTRDRFGFADFGTHRADVGWAGSRLPNFARRSLDSVMFSLTTSIASVTRAGGNLVQIFLRISRELFRAASRAEDTASSPDTHKRVSPSPNSRSCRRRDLAR